MGKVTTGLPGHLLRRLRVDQAMSAASLAERMGISLELLNDLEQNRDVNADLIISASFALGVSPVPLLRQFEAAKAPRQSCYQGIPCSDMDKHDFLTALWIPLAEAPKNLALHPDHPSGKIIHEGRKILVINDCSGISLFTREDEGQDVELPE